MNENPLEIEKEVPTKLKKKSEKSSEVIKHTFDRGKLISSTEVEKGKHYCGKDIEGKEIYV